MSEDYQIIAGSRESESHERANFFDVRLRFFQNELDHGPSTFFTWRACCGAVNSIKGMHNNRIKGDVRTSRALFRR